jgi:hypothetical protein
VVAGRSPSPERKGAGEAGGNMVHTVKQIKKWIAQQQKHYRDHGYLADERGKKISAGNTKKFAWVFGWGKKA